MSYKYFPLSGEEVIRRKTAWDGLAGKTAFGRIAICITCLPDLKELEHEVASSEEIPLAGPTNRNHDWDKNIKEQVRGMQINALSRYKDDSFPALWIPRNVHGQSQSIVEVFGCKLIPQESEQDLFFPVPWIESAQDVNRLKIKPVENCLYGKAIEFAKYACESTDGQLSIRNPVMTGPIDTANYVLGTMRLMEWIYEEPQALHKLLQIITEEIIHTVKSLQKVTNGQLCPDTGACLNRGFGLCSEVRHLISAEVFSEFEATYLRQIGEACGPYMIHSCGTWERTLQTDLKDPNLMMVNFQCREMNLDKVYEITQGKLSLSIGRSVDLDERYIWPDEASFLRYVISTLPVPAPVELGIGDINTYLAVQAELKGGPSGMFNWYW